MRSLPLCPLFPFTFYLFPSDSGLPSRPIGFRRRPVGWDAALSSNCSRSFLVLLTGQKDEKPPAPITQIHPNRRCGNLQIGAGCEWGLKPGYTSLRAASQTQSAWLRPGVSLPSHSGIRLFLRSAGGLKTPFKAGLKNRPWFLEPDFPPDVAVSIGYRKFRLPLPSAFSLLPSAWITPSALLSALCFLQLTKDFPIAFLPKFL